MDGLKVEKAVDFKGGYWVCMEKVKFIVNEYINCLQGGLIAGQQVDLSAHVITLEGTEDRPARVVGLESLKISGAQISLRNVVLYYQKEENFALFAGHYSDIKNVRIVRLRLDGTTLYQEERLYLKDMQDMESYCRGRAASKK